MNRGMSHTSSFTRRPPNWPVTPEVAGSSPVAPAKRPANHNLLSALDRRLFAHPAEIPRLDRPGIPAGSRSYPLIHAKGRPADLAGGRLSRDPGAAFVQVFFSSQATGRTESRNGSRVLVVVTSIDLGNYRFLPPAAAPAAIPSVKRGGPCLSFTKRSSRADARLTRLERSEHPRSPAACATKRAGGAPPAAWQAAASASSVGWTRLQPRCLAVGTEAERDGGACEQTDAGERCPPPASTWLLFPGGEGEEDGAEASTFVWPVAPVEPASEERAGHELEEGRHLAAVE
jgi:hypothetical protein